ncbi:MAG: hypothetical protein ACAI43_15995 [Phycisphaerae bacterium]|nr:hypothetical protein [Tepidisphaeraceae bacterium]
MSRALLPLVACLFSAQLACAGPGAKPLPADVDALLTKADEIELISISPEHLKEQPEGHFHGWRVLGRTTVKGGDKAAVLAALRAGISENDGMVAGCFNPRHGLRATVAGRTVDLVICFECMSMQVWEGGKVTAQALTTRTPQATLDRVLSAAKVELAPKGE